MHRETKFLFFVILLVGFFDWISVGFVYPLFSSILYQPDSHFINPAASDTVRGIWLGLLMALTPMLNFVFSPIVGLISDRQGRKKVLQWTLALNIVGYVVSYLGIVSQSLSILVLSRIFVGIGSSNGGVLRAIIADISVIGEKGKNFGLLNTATQLGYAFGPWLGTLLQKVSFWGLEGVTTPFLFAILFSVFSFVFLYLFLKETFAEKYGVHSHVFHVRDLKDVFRLKGLGVLLTGIFIVSFGWAYYWGFLPVTWIKELQLTPNDVGDFFAYASLVYALCSSLVIRPILDKWGEGRVTFLSVIGLGISVGLLYFKVSYEIFWIMIPVQQLMLALFLAGSPTVISDLVSPTKQGQAMGVFASVKSLGYTLSPMLSGAFIGLSYRLPMALGALSFFVAVILIYWKYGKRIWTMHPR